MEHGKDDLFPFKHVENPERKALQQRSADPAMDTGKGLWSCQAALLTGNAAATDPACALSPDREKLVRLVKLAEEAAAPSEPPEQAARLFRFRTNPLG